MRSLLLFASLAACTIACGTVPDLHFVGDDASAGSSSSSGSSSGSGSSGGSGSSSGATSDDGGSEAGIDDAGADALGPCQETPQNPPPGTQCCSNVVACRGTPGKCAGATCTSPAACGQCNPFQVCCLKNNGAWQACAATAGDCPNPS